MAQNDWKSRLGVVYSSNPDFSYETDDEREDMATLPPERQNLIISIDRKQRAGKQVTLVKGFQGLDDDLEDLGRILKSKCGVGGSAKEGVIIIQGGFRDRLIQILQNMGYKAKRGN